VHSSECIQQLSPPPYLRARVLFCRFFFFHYIYTNACMCVCMCVCVCVLLVTSFLPLRPFFSLLCVDAVLRDVCYRDTSDLCQTARIDARTHN
jgi:hypothetical protein